MSNTKRQQVLRKNKDMIYYLLSNNYIPMETVQAAMNKSGKVRYEDQVKAFNDIANEVSKRYSNQRLNEGLEKGILSNEDAKIREDFRKSLQDVAGFKPSIDDWKKYDPDQMSELAESLGYNWANTEDRSKLIRGLADYSIKKDRQESYKQYKEEHPIAAWINENIISPSTSDALRKGEEVETADVVSDVVNAGTYLIPGVGAGKSALGIGGRMLAGAAIEEGNNILQNYAQDKDLINTGDLLEAATIGTLPQLGSGPFKQTAKKIGNYLSPDKEVGNAIEKGIDAVIGETKSEKLSAAKKNIETRSKEAEQAVSKRKRYNKEYKEGKISPNEIAAKREANDEALRAGTDLHQKQKLLKELEEGSLGPINSRKAQHILRSDEDFARVVDDLINPDNSIRSLLAETGTKTARNALKYGTKSAYRQARNKSEKPSSKIKPISKMLDKDETDLQTIIDQEKDSWAVGMRPWKGGAFADAPDDLKDNAYVRAYYKWKQETGR